MVNKINLSEQSIKNYKEKGWLVLSNVFKKKEINNSKKYST